MGPEHLAMLVPIIGTLMGVGLVMLIVYLDYCRRSEALKHSHAERMAAIEKGIELPPAPEPRQNHGQLNLEGLDPAARLMVLGRISVVKQRRSGLVLVCVGATITLAMWQTGLEEFWWGLVPTAIGLAQLVSGLVESGELRRAAAKQVEIQPPAV